MFKEHVYPTELDNLLMLKETGGFDSNQVPNMDSETLDFSDSLDIYMKQAVIVALPRLTFEQEFIVASKIQKGLREIEILPDGTEKQKIIEENRKAKNLLVLKHLLFVIPHAKKYSNCGVELQDLINEGNLILFEAAEKFDPTKGHRFSTYSHFLLRDKLLRYVCNFGRVIRLPEHLETNIFRMNKIERELYIRFGRKPTINELCKETGYSAKKVEELMLARREVISLDKPIKKADDLDFELGATIPDQKNVDVFEQNINKIDSDIFFKKMQKLVEHGIISDRDSKVLSYRYGRFDNTFHTLDKTGSFFKISRQRVAEIEKKTISKISL